MKVGSLFSGAGLGDFGYEMAGYDLRWQVENNEYARKILDLRWPKVKKYGDIKTIESKELEPVDLITGGFPCQPFSVAGKQHGKDDDRNLWPEMLRIIKALKPRYVVAENVPGIIPLYLDTVLADLGDAGYTCWPFVFSSHSLGAWHKRDRLWIIAYSGLLGSPINEKQTAGVEQLCEIIPNTESIYAQRCDRGPREVQPWRDNWWSAEPELGRVAHGITKRVDRLKCLGNGQTPCSTYVIGKYLMEFNKLVN